MKTFPPGYIFTELLTFEDNYSRTGTWAEMRNDESTTGRKALEMAQAFGSLIRSRRRALNMTQDQLALATGVGRRFVIELEGGKSSCHLGRSLLVASALGLTPAEILASREQCASAAVPELPDLPEDMEQPDGSLASVL